MVPTSRRAKLADLVTLNPRLAKPLGSEDLVSFVPMIAVDADTASISTTEVRRYADVSKGYTTFEDGDILVAKITPCFENGKIAQVKIVHSPGFGSTEFHVLRPHHGELDSRYLLHYLRQDRVRHDGERKMTGSAGQRRVPPHFFENLYLLLPPIVEQRRIAAALDQVEELRGKRREALTQLEELTQSIFFEMFGDPTKRQESWNISNLRNIVSEFRYGTSNKSQPQGVPTLRIPNVTNSEIDTSDLKLVPVSSSERERLRLLEGDLLFVRTNGNPNLVGRCAIYNRDVAARSGRPGEDFIYASYLIRARLKMDVISPVYLREFMLGPAGRRALRSRSKTSAGQFNINTESLGAIEVPVPPLDLQQEYVRRVEAVAELKNNHRAYLAELDALSASLQYRAFQGEL